MMMSFYKAKLETSASDQTKLHDDPTTVLFSGFKIKNKHLHKYVPLIFLIINFKWIFFYPQSAKKKT